MLVPAVCAMLTAIQTFPLDGLYPKAFGGASSEYPIVVEADISSRLGWNLHIEPLGTRQKAKIHTTARLARRPYVQATNKSSHTDDPAWKMLLADTNRFIDAIHKQLKPTNSTSEGTSTSNTRTGNVSLEFTLGNSLANGSHVSLSKKLVHTSTVTPPCEKSSRSRVEGTKLRAVHAGTTVLTHGRDRAVPSVESKRMELVTSQAQSHNGSSNVLPSTVPLKQSKKHSNKVRLSKPSVGTNSAPAVPRTATTSPNRRRLLHSRRKTITPTATRHVSGPPQKITRISETRATHASVRRVDDATERDDVTILGLGSSKKSKARRLRRRKKRPKLNLFQPRQRKPTDGQKWPPVRKCLAFEVRQRTSRCEPEQQKPDDHMTESSVVRPRIYGLEPVVGSEKEVQPTIQPLAEHTRPLRVQPPEEPASRESQEDYYNYSPEYHDEEDYHDHHSYESPEDVRDEDHQEVGRRERYLARPDVASEMGGLSKIDANLTRVKAAATGVDADDKSIAETKRLNHSDVSEDAEDPVSQSASSHALNDTVEGFTLLIEDDSEFASAALHRDTQNSSAEQGPNRDPEELKLPPNDPATVAASELAATSGAQQMTRDKDITHEAAQGTSSNRKGNTGYSKFFSFAEVPAHGHHRFGYRKGNDQHFTGRLEVADGPHVKSVVVWADRRGGHGKHIWDLNHE